MLELKIGCEFFDRGCGKFVQLGDLERHVTDCGFAPAVCSNEGCQLEVNKQDLLHHETVVCEIHRVKCHSCNDMKREMETMKANLAAINEKFDRNEKKLDKHDKKLLETLERVETNGKALKNVAGNVETIRKQHQEENNSREEIKMTFNVITKQLERIIQQTSPPDVRAKQEQAKKENAETFCETVTVENSTINFGKSSDDKKIAKHETAADLSSMLDESLAAKNVCKNDDIPSISHQPPQGCDAGFSLDSAVKNDVACVRL